MNFVNSYSFEQASFKFRIDTNNTGNGSSANNEFELPLIATFSPLNLIVNWGDGIESNITNPTQSETLHQYNTRGVYDIEITGEMTGWQFNNNGDREKMLEISNWGIFKFDVQSTFRNCENLLITATDSPIISTLRNAFRDCDALQIFDVSNWDLSSCTSLRETFRNAGSVSGLLTFLDVSNWDTSNVNSIQSIIRSTSLSVFDTTNWNTSSVTNMKDAFRDNQFWDYSMANFDMSNVTDLKDILRGGQLSTANYDATLISWASQTLGQNEQTNFGDSEYTGGGVAEVARTSIINDFGWTIRDGGSV